VETVALHTRLKPGNEVDCSGAAPDVKLVWELE
jgi:hypothetical protein